MLMRFSRNTNTLQSNKVYWTFIDKIKKLPISVGHWLSEFPFLVESDFKDFFMLPKYITGNTKLQCFQYKILHRIFPCNHMLSKWKVVNNSSCSRCCSVDTVEHFFFYCHECVDFWHLIENWFKTVTEVYIPLKVTNVLFGIPFTRSQDKLLSVLNFIILHAKYHLYVCKKDNRPISLTSFLHYLKYTLRIEKDIAVMKQKQDQFNTLWSFIYSAL